MGEVYRARDSRLDREVAIKMLPVNFATDPDRLKRFEQEARTTSALNHPNILTVYDIGTHEGSPYIVSELLHGEELREELTSGGLSQRKAIDYAQQIAQGLAAAHEKGITHRDLKPENLFVTSDGRVKILDFGIAKLRPQRSDEISSEGATVKQITDPGTVMGTVGYMSPEQVRGLQSDHRSDIFSFGAILYEMLSGQRAFRRDTAAETMTAILKEEPPELSETNPKINLHLDKVVRRCLEKKPERRFQSAYDLGFALESINTTSGGIPSTTVSSFTASSPSWFSFRNLGWAVAALLLVAAVLLLMIQRSGPTSSRQFTLTIVPPADIQLRPVGTMGSVPQISPDGSAVMFQGGEPRQMYIRHLDSLELLKVPGSDAVSNEAFWHGVAAISVPTSGRQIADIRLPDGAPENLISLSSFTRGGSWSDQGTLLISAISQLMMRKADGTPARVSVPDKRPGALVYPEFLSRSEDFLVFFKPEDGDGEVWLATLNQGVVTTRTVLFKNDTAARYTAWDGGRILFVKNDNLYSQRLNRSAQAVEGEPELVVKGVASQPGLMRADFSVSDNGTVAWRPGHAALAQVTVFDRKGAVINTAGQAGAIESVYVSPSDDSRLLVLGASDVIAEVGQSGMFALPRDTVWLNWLGDGKRVLGLQGENRLVARSADNIGRSEEIGLLPTGTNSIKLLSPDGKFVVARIPPSGGGGWARLSDPSQSAWTPLVGTDEQHADLGFSPDGRFIIYDAFPSSGIYVQPFPGPGRRQLINQSGIDPAWRGDGKEIVFISDNAVWSVSVSGLDSNPTFAPPIKLFEGVRRAPGSVAQSQGLAISHDGSRIFIVQGVEQPDTNVINVMSSLAPRPR